MFEDPDLQDPMSLSLNENCHDQSSQHPKKAQVSPEYNCEPPEIQVIIKEEEDGWTVSEYVRTEPPAARSECGCSSPDWDKETGAHNSGALFPSLASNESSEDEKEDASTHPYHPHLTASGRESSVSQGGKRQQRGYLVGKCPEESGGLAVYGQSSSTREERQKHTIKGYEQRPKISLRDQCNNTEQENTSIHVKNLRSQRRAQEGGECYSKDQRLDVRQSTSLPTEAEPHKTKQSARGQTDSPHHKSMMSCGLRREPSHLEDQTLHLTVRLQAGDEEEEEETAQEEEEDEEISGLINSDGEVVEWDAKERSNRGSDGSESPRSRKLKGQKLRDSGSPTLIMEVVSGEDEEREAREEKERETKMGPASTSYRGRGARRQKRSPKKTPLSVDVADANKSVPPTPPKRRGKRRSSEVPLLSEAEMDAEPGMSRRTRGKRNAPIIDEPEEFESKSVRRVTGKRPCRKKKDTKPSIKEEGENTESPTGKKKRPGRKMIQYPVEIPPELLKKPKEKIEYHCSVCGKEFPHAYKLERHELIHTGEKPYCCSICGRGFNQKGNLKTHYKVHLGRKGAVDFPDEVNPSASELSEYLKSLPGESRIRSSHRCLECGKECESQSALQAHHITAHTGAAGESNAAEQDASQLLLCRRCGIQFNNKEKMEEHMKTHIKEKRYSCPDCGKRFINESYIQVHQRIHTGEKPYLCSLCGQGFHTASSLKLHEMQHSGERPFSCNICGKSFRINSYLTAHYQTHIKDRPFICSVCGKGYSRSEELKVHHRLHTGERPYECGECGKSFIYRQGLRQHQRTHAGRRMGPTRQLGRPKQESRLDI